MSSSEHERPPPSLDDEQIRAIRAGGRALRRRQRVGWMAAFLVPVALLIGAATWSLRQTGDGPENDLASATSTYDPYSQKDAPPLSQAEIDAAQRPASLTSDEATVTCVDGKQKVDADAHNDGPDALTVKSSVVSSTPPRDAMPGGLDAFPAIGDGSVSERVIEPGGTTHFTGEVDGDYRGTATIVVSTDFPGAPAYAEAYAVRTFILTPFTLDGTCTGS